MRYAILRISPYFFIEFFRHDKVVKAKISSNILPEDSKFVRAFTGSDAWGYICLVIESEKFDALKEGDEIPILPYPIFERVEA